MGGVFGIAARNEAAEILVNGGKENGTEFIHVDLSVIKTFFGLVFRFEFGSRSDLFRGRGYRLL